MKWSALVVGAISVFSTLFAVGDAPAGRANGQASITGPGSFALALNTPNQDPGDFVISGYGVGDTLSVSIGLVSPPAGTTFSLTTTSGLTPATGYSLAGNKTELTFTGTMADANAALAGLRVTTGATPGAVTFRVSASISEANVFYNSVNGHYYEYVETSSTAFNTADPTTSAYHLADARVKYGVRGYLATITSAQEQKFILEIVTATNIWIGASDDFEVINLAVGSTRYANQVASEGKWYWVTGPEAGTQFWEGSTDGLWINSTTNATMSATAGNESLVRYENWCTGNPNPYSLTVRARGEPNNAGSEENFALEKWNGTPCWNDWGSKASGTQPGFLVEYSQNWGTGADARGSFSGSTIASAEVTAFVTGPPTAPTISAISSTSNSLAVDFTAPTSNGGAPITNYQYSLDNGSTWTSLSPASTVSALTITGVSPSTTYQVKIRAFNGLAGAESNMESVSTQAAPSPPPIFVSPPTTAAPTTTVPSTSTPPTSTPQIGETPREGAQELVVTPQIIEQVKQDGFLTMEGGEIVETALNEVGPGEWELEGNNFAMNLEVPDAVDPVTGETRPGSGTGAVTLVRDSGVLSEGSGFSGDSWVDVWMYEEAGVSAASSTGPRIQQFAPVYLGAIRVSADGEFSGELPVPGALPVGGYFLQANGLSAEGNQRSMNLSVDVIDSRPLTLPVTGAGSSSAGLVAFWLVVVGGLVMAARVRRPVDR